MQTYSVRRLAAMATGLAVIAAETLINIGHVREQAQAWFEQPLVIAVGLAGVAQAVAISVFVDAVRKRRFALALVTLCGLAAAVAFTFSTTYERTATAREGRRITISTANAPASVAAANIDAKRELADRECAQIRGPECRKREAELASARATYAAQPMQKSLSHLGAFEMVPELALPLMLLLCGFAFIAYSESESGQTSFPVVEGEPLPGKELFQPYEDDAGAPDVADRAAKVSQFEAFYVAKHGKRPSAGTVAKATGLPRATAHRYQRRARSA